MKKRIYLNVLILTALSVILASVFLVMTFYKNFADQVKSELESQARMLEATLNIEDNQADYLEQLHLVDSDIRITLIGVSGTVLYDNTFTDESTLENHSEREEIKAAIKDGFGEEERLSKTFGTETYYYAIRLQNGNIIRTAKTTSSVFGVLTHVLPQRLLIIVAILLAGLVIANGMLILFLDVTEKEKSEKLRREFTANVSHELRTPLTTISGYAELMANGMVQSEDITSVSEKMKNESDRLLALIEDIMRLSELDEEDRVKDFTWFDLTDLIGEVADNLRVKAQKNNTTINIPKGQYTINASRPMIYELIYNLIDNAIKYNKQDGSVSVMVSQNDGNTTISVRDTGIGIDKKHQDRIFERFYRVDKSRSKKIGGTGLGLSIVKHIVIYHKGNIKVESEAGLGTKVDITL